MGSAISSRPLDRLRVHGCCSYHETNKQLHTQIHRRQRSSSPDFSRQNLFARAEQSSRVDATVRISSSEQIKEFREASEETRAEDLRLILATPGFTFSPTTHVATCKCDYTKAEATASNVAPSLRVWGSAAVSDAVRKHLHWACIARGILGRVSEQITCAQQ